MTLVVRLIFPTVLLKAWTSYKPSRFFFCLCAASFFRAILTCTLLSLRGIGLEIPSDTIGLGSSSFGFCCSLRFWAFAAQMTFSISSSEYMPVSAHCSSVRYYLPGMISSSISVQVLHSRALANISRMIYGHQMFCARDSISKLPGCMEWTSSRTASLMALCIAIRSSMHKHPCFTLISCQYDWIYGLIPFNPSSSLRMTRSRTSSEVAFFPAKMANNFLLKILLIVSVIRISSAVSMALLMSLFCYWTRCLLLVLCWEVNYPRR